MKKACFVCGKVIEIEDRVAKMDVACSTKCMKKEFERLTSGRRT